MRPQVLVVEDDGENCRALTELLAAEGFDPLPFESGEAAWSAIAGEQIRPHAVVADVRMPGLDGVALLRRIKARFPTLPVILVSAFAEEEAWAEGLRAGAVDVFPKPIQGASLVRTLLKAVGADREEGLPLGGNSDPRPAGIADKEDREMKQFVLSILAAAALLVGVSPAFADQTIVSPALPNSTIVEPYGMFSETWFALGASGVGG